MSVVHNLEIISNEEADRRCDHDWDDTSFYEVINPNGEFVVGYGNAPVSVRVGIERRCIKCGRTIEVRGGKEKACTLS